MNICQTENLLEGNVNLQGVHIKRPMNPFMVWSRNERKLLQQNHPRMHNSEISKLLGARWKEMDKCEKTQYIHESERLRKMHRKMYPNYRYRPQKKDRIKPTGMESSQNRKNLEYGKFV